jgi:tellurite resistance protein
MSDNAVTTTNSGYSELWLRGLLTVAWADGHYTEDEKALVSDLLGTSEVNNFQPLNPQQLTAVFNPNDPKTDDFLRTAVMVAIADGTYSESEDQLLQEFCQVLGRSSEILSGLQVTLVKREGEQCVPSEGERHDLLDPIRRWLDQMQIHDPKIARFLCRMIPSQCPFERDVILFGRKIVHIPPMCKLNPLYEQLVGLRFRALSYLADQGEDVPN